MTTISTRTVKILAFVLSVLAAAIALVTSGAITLDVQVAEEVPAVEAPVEAEAPAEVPVEVPAETQVVDEAADAPSADAPSADAPSADAPAPASDVAVEASGG